MKIRLLNWLEESMQVCIGAKKNIVKAEMKISNGREVLTVFYKDGTHRTFGSHLEERERLVSGRYPVYDPERGIDLLANRGWLADDNASTRAVDYISF